jgi:type IV pilus assembly protein PilB
MEVGVQQHGFEPVGMPDPDEVTLSATPPVVDAPGGMNGVTEPSRRGGARRVLTDVIVELGFMPEQRILDATDIAHTKGQPIGRMLVDTGELSEDQLARATAERYGLDHLNLSLFKVDMGAANLVNPSAAKRYESVPVAFVDERTLLVAMVDPANVLALDDIAIMTGLEVRPAVASREDVLSLIARLNRIDESVALDDAAAMAAEGGEEIDVRETADDAPVIKLVHSIIAQAAEQGASDIHFEPVAGGDMAVRFRVDGVLSTGTTIPRRMTSGVISRIKIMADLDISEKRVPQDGRVGLSVEGRRIDIRVVSLPLVAGESVVMRILDKDQVLIQLEQLGMQDQERDRFTSAFTQSHGAVLVTGPTGSGKTTTLYGALDVINTPDKNIITIEDPVEYQLVGVKQVQVNPKAGLTFATGLRSMMRADPDVIMVGEIRDRETAQIAVESALTGHLVLSTLHTNDAPSAVTRLIEMGIEPFLVASAIDAVVAQRLARKLCESCRTPVKIRGEVLRANGYTALGDIEAFEPGKCARCGGTGYRGRVGLYEVMLLNDEIRSMVIERRPAIQIAAAAEKAGMRHLRDDGLDKVRQGITSVAEVGRVSGALSN